MESWLQIVPADVRAYLLAFLADTPTAPLLLRDLGYVTNVDMLVCVQLERTRIHYNRTAPMCTLAGLADKWLDCITSIEGAANRDFRSTLAALAEKKNHVPMVFPPLQPMDYVICAYVVLITAVQDSTIGDAICEKLIQIMIRRRLLTEFTFIMDIWQPNERHLHHLLFDTHEVISDDFLSKIMHIPRVRHTYYDAWIDIASNSKLRGCFALKQSEFVFAWADAPNVLVFAINTMNQHGLGWCSARRTILEHNATGALVVARRLAADVDPKRAEFGRYAIDLLQERLQRLETPAVENVTVPCLQQSSLCQIV